MIDRIIVPRVDGDGQDLPPLVQVVIPKEMSPVFKAYFDECIWDKDTQAWFLPIAYLSRVDELIASLSDEIAEYEKIKSEKLASDMEAKLDVSAFKAAARDAITAASSRKRS